MVYARDGEAMAREIERVDEMLCNARQKKKPGIAQKLQETGALDRCKNLDDRFEIGFRYFERAELYAGDYDELKRHVVAQHIAILLGAYPNAGPHNPEIYTRVLVEDVHAAKPSASALEATCRKLRRTSKFVPTVAELLAVLAEEKERWFMIFEFRYNTVENSLKWYHEEFE